MGTHTPGPWEVCNGSDVFTRLGARNASGAVAAENDGWHIADCDMGPSSTGEGEADIPHTERRANARLIAAAPTYYEAGVEFHAYEGAIAAGDDMAAMQHYARASQLLAEAHAKATGGES